MRLHFVVEGQTEETFVNRVLAAHLSAFSVWADARCVMTRRKCGITHRGGLTRYERARKDIVLWMKEDQNSDAAFTTMFDLYALPEDFPGISESREIADPRARVTALEDALRLNISHQRFIPYLQLHEFEALVLADPRRLDCQFFEHQSAIEELTRLTSEFESPELIDDGNDTAPSKRIIRQIPEYAGMKATAGPLVVGRIGLAVIRKSCPHFGEWLQKLEGLERPAGT